MTITCDQSLHLHPDPSRTRDSGRFQSRQEKGNNKLYSLHHTLSFLRTSKNVLLFSLVSCSVMRISNDNINNSTFYLSVARTVSRMLSCISLDILVGLGRANETVTEGYAFN